MPRFSRLRQFVARKTPQKLKNPSDLQVRFRTGLVYTLITLICIFAGDIPFILYLSAVAGLCAGEFYYVVRQDRKLPNEILGILFAVSYPLVVYFFGLGGALVVTTILLVVLLVWYVFWLPSHVSDVGISFFGAAYTGMLLCGFVVIRQALQGIWGSVALLLIMISVWGNDAFAYLVGSRFGRHKMTPQISPNKSWEGFFAGLLGSVIFWICLSFVPVVNMGVVQAVAFGLISGVCEVVGDLAESRIKRNSGVKDSGVIMPGHGGLLDRCDSLFLASVSSAVLLVAGGCIPFSI